MIQVIVVPEKTEFKEDVLQGEVIYINSDLGEPRLMERNAKYVVPYWLDSNKAERIYQILDMKLVGNSYEIYLGNSFLIEGGWNKLGNRVRFEYHPLDSFGFKEVQNGFLIP